MSNLVILNTGGQAFNLRYWNANGFAVAVVLVVMPDVDWSVYVGATPEFGPVRLEDGIPGALNQEAPWGHWLEEDTCRWVATHGCKMREEDARYLAGDVTFRGKLVKEMRYRP